MVMNIEHRHPLYEAYLERWHYYRASYLGGFDYRNASLGMLRKYLFEDDTPGDQYQQRLEYTALDNMTKLTVDTYRSFLWRAKPTRTFGYLQDDIVIRRFIEDVDFSGKDLDDFMKEANDLATVYGHVWILCTKGQGDGILTKEQEIEQDIRPYLKVFSPEAVEDWKYQTMPNGAEKLTYVKTREHIADDTFKYIQWTNDAIYVSYVEDDKVIGTEQYPNTIGEVPFIVHYANTTDQKGLGHSDIGDVAKIQQAVMNLLSESEQSIRISGHPTLVKTGDVGASAGAGAIINLDNTMDPNLRPYLLEPSGSNVDSIINMITVHVEAFLRTTHLGAIMAARGLSAKSGVALATEFEMLNTRLADKAAKMEATEWNIWNFFWKWSNQQPDEDFNIVYHKTFDLRDEHADLTLLERAKNLALSSDTFNKEVEKQIAKIVIEDGDKLDDIYREIDGQTMRHDTVTAETKTPHIQEMIMEGLSDAQMLELHPEINQSDIDTAKAELLEKNNGV